MVAVRRCRHQILRNFPSLGGPYGIYSITIHQCPLIFVTLTFVSLFHFMDSLICYFVPRGMSKDQRNDMAFFFLNSWNTNTLWNFLFIMKEFGPLNECSTMCTMCSAVNIVLFCVLQYLISGLLNWSSSKKCRDSVLCESAVGSCLKYTVQRFSYKSEAFCFII